jgi:phage-related protein|uniref:Tail tape measure protein n=1 Tax=Myoviridae sp. ctXVO17 TaxID=2825121 RepID=A0A8S5P213_9CAUD|nr:MAG TPA: tail tape measure protein [Myoviridae sp. ctXVO17]
MHSALNWYKENAMELFKIFGRIALKGQEETEDGLDSVAGKASGVGQALLKGIGTFAKWGAAAATAAATATAALVKSAVTAYSDYEQLVGGVETLFKDSASEVQKYAANAYQTAGLSANEYMETVTGFSASLLQSLDGDTKAAAEKANVAITDMSDNANKMGTSMESIQNAYQGFAKQNYTMLDNLKLGYGGTKEEMQRLLEDAEKLSCQKFDLSSYADIVDAIHVVQTEMGITGTTAKEAATTIQGSVNMTKAAWQNLVVGIADDTQDFDVLVNNFVESVTTAGNNILPRVEIALKGVGTLVEKLAPIIAKTVPNIVSTTLPSMIKAGTSMIRALLDGLLKAVPELIPCFKDIINQLIEVIVDNLPLIIEAAVTIAGAIVSGLVEALPDILTAGIQLIQSLAQGLTNGIPTILSTAITIVSQLASTLIQNVPQIVQTGIQLLLGLANGILQAVPQLLQELPGIITQMVENILSCIPMIIECGIELLTSLVDALPQIIQSIVAVLPQIISSIIEALLSHIDEIIQAGIKLLVALIDALPQIIDTICKALPQIIEGITGALLDHIDDIIAAGVELFMALVTNLPQIIVSIAGKVPQIITGIVSAIGQCLGEMWEAGKRLMNKLWEGMKAIAPDIAAWTKEFVKSIFTLNINVGGVAQNIANKAAQATGSGNTGSFTARKHAKGGVVEKGEIALLEGDGAEAVVPLHQNRMWISRVAQDMKNALDYGQSSSGSKNDNALLELIYELLERLPDLILEGMESVNMKVDKREFARMVKEVTAT